MLGEITAGIRGKDLEIEKPSFGVALVMVGIDPSRNGENATQPKLWTIKEKKTKPPTGRIAGQTSFIGESRKLNKSVQDTIAGALAGEFSDNRSLIESSVFMTPSWFAAKRIQVGNKPFDLAILVFAGSLNQEINPSDSNEVAPNGWMTVEEIQKLDPHKNPAVVREFVHQVISLHQSEGLITRVILEYEQGLRKPLSSILPEGFIPREFFNRREEMSDVFIPQGNGR